MIKVGQKYLILEGIGTARDYVGQVVTVEKVNSEIPGWFRSTDGICFYSCSDKFKLVKDKFTPPFYVDCPTKKIWNKVEQKMIDMGSKWSSGDLHIDSWTKYNENSYISLGTNLIMHYGSKQYYNNNKTEYCKSIPYQEFLGIEDRIIVPKDIYVFGSTFKEDFTTCPPIINNSLKEKTMSLLTSIPNKIKRVLNPNYQAFYQLGWVDRDLELTEKGKSELLSSLLEKNEKEFGVVAMAEIKRIKKAEKIKDEE